MSLAPLGPKLCLLLFTSVVCYYIQPIRLSACTRSLEGNVMFYVLQTVEAGIHAGNKQCLRQETVVFTSCTVPVSKLCRLTDLTHTVPNLVKCWQSFISVF